MTISSQEPAEPLSDDQVKRLIPDRDPKRLQMVAIDNHVWMKGPDGFWYRSEGSDA